MVYLSEIAKENLARQALNLNTFERIELAKSNNIGYSTLCKWVCNYRSRNEGTVRFNKSQEPSFNTKLSHILATTNLADNEVGAYCRSKGLYTTQLLEWKNKLMTTNIDENNRNKGALAEIKTLKIEIEKLKSELRRKDKALAETAALLVLKKKADIIWGDRPED